MSLFGVSQNIEHCLSRQKSVVLGEFGRW